MVAVTQIACMAGAMVATVNALMVPFVQNSDVSFGGQFYGLPGAPGNDERPIPGDSPIVQCDVTEPQILNLQSVILEPNPPVRGANLTVVAKGYLSQDIVDGAYVEVDVRYGFIKLLHQTFDICEEIQKVDLECPIEAGQQIIIKEVEIPQEVPPGKYLVNARAYTKDDEFITCLTATVEFPAS